VNATNGGNKEGMGGTIAVINVIWTVKAPERCRASLTVLSISQDGSGLLDGWALAIYRDALFEWTHCCNDSSEEPMVRFWWDILSSLIGAIAGDIIGSIYEVSPIKSKDFPLFDRRSCFTDDSVLTVAVADVIVHGGGYVERFRDYYRRYPDRGYGGGFHVWAQSSQPKPYGSYGNGSAMRVSPVGFAFHDLQTVLAEAKRSAEVTHDHPEGIKGAQAIAAAVYLVRNAVSLGGLVPR
jgi:hypothetical protein